MTPGRNTSGLRKGGGRVSPNKMTKSAKEAFAAAFDELGGAKALGEWATENPTEFYKLYARLIPTEVAGDPTSPLSIRVTFE